MSTFLPGGGGGHCWNIGISPTVLPCTGPPPKHQCPCRYMCPKYKGVAYSIPAHMKAKHKGAPWRLSFMNPSFWLFFTMTESKCLLHAWSWDRGPWGTWLAVLPSGSDPSCDRSICCGSLQALHFEALKHIPRRSAQSISLSQLSEHAKYPNPLQIYGRVICFEIIRMWKQMSHRVMFAYRCWSEI